MVVPITISQLFVTISISNNYIEKVVLTQSGANSLKHTTNNRQKSHNNPGAHYTIEVVKKWYSCIIDRLS